MNTTAETERGFTIVRRLQAPREVVFQAWTDPDHLQWFANPNHPPRHPTTVDLRVGGEWRLSMVEHEAKSYTTGGVYREIVPPERLVFTWGVTGGWPDYDAERPENLPICTVTLKDLGDATEMIFDVAFADNAPEDVVKHWYAVGFRDGFTQTVDRIVPYLNGAAQLS
jgi:uncharacterized protein YndB with AHSA1/START domain